MGPKTIVYGDKARMDLMTGVDKVANAVKVTLGPRGRNVVIADPKQGPTVVNDGVTIAASVDLEVPQENVGVQLLLQAAAKTDSRAGDGTTTSTVLTQAIVRSGLRYISNGHNSVAMQRGLVKAASFFVDKIREAATPVNTIEQYESIATISTGSEEMGARVAEAVFRVGGDGSTVLEVGKELADTVEYTEGMEHEVGWINSAFVKDQESQTTTQLSPRILVTDEKLSVMNDVLKVLEGVVASQEPLLIIAPDVTGEAISGLTLNKNRGVVDVCVVKAPGFGDVRRAFLEDICCFTGAKFITSELALSASNATVADLGRATSVVVSKSKLVLVSTGEHDAAVEQRVEQLKAQIQTKLNTEKEFEIQRLEQRITKLRGIVARIIVGAPTETEAEDRRLRYEDAINALQGAVAEGMVPGGGACLTYMTRFADEARALFTDEEEEAAVDVLLAAMAAPIKQIANNAGVLGEMVFEKVKGQEWGYGFNAKSLEYEDLFEAGVCDPASVTTWALENAASISGSLLTTEALICDATREEIEEYDPEFTTGIQDRAADMAW